MDTTIFESLFVTPGNVRVDSDTYMQYVHTIYSICIEFVSVGAAICLQVQDNR